MRSSWHSRALAVGAAVAILSLGACGGDDDDGASAAATGFCTDVRALDVAFAALNAETGSPEEVITALDAAAASAPDEVSDDAQTLVTETKAQLASGGGGEEGGGEEEGGTTETTVADDGAADAEGAAFSTQAETTETTETTEAEPDAAPEDEGGGEEEGPPEIPSDEFFAANGAVADYLADNCDWNNVDVTAKNYDFEGIDQEQDAGATLLRLTNEGTEFHEIIVFKIAAGEDRPLPELLELPEDEAAELATEVASTFAPPEATVYTTAELDAGRYGVVCFIPVGATPDALASGDLDESAAPHFTKGMTAEFTVS